MGIIQKQAIQSTILSYLGTLFGFLNLSILMPKILSIEEIGLLSVVNSLTKIFAVVFTLGGPLVALNLFNKYKNPKSNHNGFLSLLTFLSLLGIIVGLGIYFLFHDFIVTNKETQAYKFFTLAFVIIFIFRLLFLNFDAYLRINRKTVIGVLLERFLAKILFSISLIALLLGMINFDGIFISNIIVMSLPGFIILFYLISQKEKFFNWENKRRYAVRYKKIIGLSVFGVIGGTGAMFMMEIDRIMVNNMVGLGATGIYSTMFFFGLFIATPADNIKRIAATIIAESWKSKDLDNINDIYKKSALNLLISGAYLFMGIWFSMDYLLDFLPKEFATGKYIVFFIGLAQLIELATGVNAEILVSSKHYKMNTWFIATLIGVVAGLNYIFIPIDGIIGAAYSSMISIAFVNLLRFLYLKRKYNFTPFSKSFVQALFISLIIYGIMSLIPKIPIDFFGKLNPAIGILINGGILTILFWPGIYFSKVSPDINTLIDKLLIRLKLKKNVVQE
ncbi:MAG: polysaccharide biosynthesis C-terminal domain-containing protein [Crocinitomicaceae bacterium]|nr:polysaccharide biosynthesis C-terminal domain-containing protein [Crocinitomicaceae bacterium]